MAQFLEPAQPDRNLPAVPVQDPKAAHLAAGWLLERPSPETRTAYTKDLGRFITFLAAHNVQLLDARRGHVAAWAEAMRHETKPDGTRRISEATIARRLSVVSSYFAYGVAEGELAANPVENMRRPKRVIDEDGATWLNTEQMKAFLAAAREDSPRSHALAAVMLTTGARVTEVLNADAANLGHTGGHRVLAVTRKGGKQQNLPIAPWVGVVVDAYLDGRTDGPLFATQPRTGGHGRLDQPAVHRLVRRLAKRAGLPHADSLHPHSLRHSAITGALEAGGTLRDVQAMAGHADPRTTERYDRMRGRLDKSPVYALAAELAE